MKSSNIGCLAALLLPVLWLAAIGYVTAPARNPLNHVSPAVETSAAAKVLTAQQATAQQATLRAKSWNEGRVHVWSDLADGPSSTFIDIAEGTRCERLDNSTYRIQDGGPPIYYYKLACNGVIGYVEIDQVR